MLLLAKILLFPLVMIGLFLKAYDKIKDYISYRIRIWKKWKESDKIEDWWI